MALTRKYLKELGIESEKIDLIIDAHTDVVDGLKTERDGFKEKAAKVDDLNAEIETLKAQSGSDSDWEEKYNKEHAEYEKYKANVEAKEEAAAKESAYTGLLKEAGVSEKLIGLILKGTDLAEIEMADGKIKDADKLTASIKEEYKDYITTSESGGVKTETPPAEETKTKTDLGTLSMEEYIKARNKA